MLDSPHAQHPQLIRTIHPVPITPKAIRLAVHRAHRKVQKHRQVLVQRNEAIVTVQKLKREVRWSFIRFHINN